MARELRNQTGDWAQAVDHKLPTLVVTRSASVVMMVAVPAAVGEGDAAAQGQQSKQGNQPCDSTEHLNILMVVPQ